MLWIWDNFNSLNNKKEGTMKFIMEIAIQDSVKWEQAHQMSVVEVAFQLQHIHFQWHQFLKSQQLQLQLKEKQQPNQLHQRLSLQLQEKLQSQQVLLKRKQSQKLLLLKERKRSRLPKKKSLRLSQVQMIRKLRKNSMKLARQQLLKIFHHQKINLMMKKLKPNLKNQTLLQLLSQAHQRLFH